jgi:hypothetical protein
MVNTLAVERQLIDLTPTVSQRSVRISKGPSRDEDHATKNKAG